MSAPEGWADGMRAVHAEARGVLDIVFVTPADALELVLASALGDAEATGLLNCVAQGLAQIRKAPRKRPVLCLACPRPIHTERGATICVFRPSVDAPETALASAVCQKCAAASDLRSRAAEALRQIWPEARLIEISGQRGHA